MISDPQNSIEIAVANDVEKEPYRDVDVYANCEIPEKSDAEAEDGASKGRGQREKITARRYQGAAWIGR
jgi:hypothetical protein